MFLGVGALTPEGGGRKKDHVLLIHTCKMFKIFFLYLFFLTELKLTANMDKAFFRNCKFYDPQSKGSDFLLQFVAKMVI